jgi:hypothetical protein
MVLVLVFVPVVPQAVALHELYGPQGETSQLTGAGGGGGGGGGGAAAAPPPIFFCGFCEWWEIFFFLQSCWFMF